ncbi:MAG: hypothetical protein JJ965_04110 [Alphaproteobacteria bacterium]|nr:hypothetical protein [Alphaproteobacteria bacterium]
MSGGLFTVDRSIWEHDLFSDEPMTEREAWLWLIGEAAWKPRKVRLGYSLIDIERGQLTHSVRFMADKWKWNKDRVARFLNMLKNRDMIETGTATGQTVITICNYEKFQNFDEYRETVARQEPRQQRDGNETAARQQRDKEEHQITPDKQITIVKGASEIDLDQLQAGLEASAGNALNRTIPGLFDLSRPLAWIAAGCDFELDVLPTVKRLAGNKPPNSIKGWKFFEQAVMDAKASRTAPVPEGQARASPAHQTQIIDIFATKDPAYGKP